MKTLLTAILLIPTLSVILQGCSAPGPSPEQQARDAEEEKAAERQQAEFRKSLPPVSNPGEGF